MSYELAVLEAAEKIPIVSIFDTVDDYISMYLRTQWKPKIIVGGKMKYFRRSTTSSALNL